MITATLAPLTIALALAGSLSSAFLVGCAEPDASDPEGATVEDAIVRAGNNSGRLSFDCKPTRPFSFTRLLIEVSAADGALTYLVEGPSGSFASGAATQTASVDDEVPVPEHAVTLSAAEGPPRTRTTGMTFLTIRATGAFVRRAPSASRTSTGSPATGVVTARLVKGATGFRLSGFTGLDGEVDTLVPDGLITCARR